MFAAVFMLAMTGAEETSNYDSYYNYYQGKYLILFIAEMTHIWPCFVAYSDCALSCMSNLEGSVCNFRDCEACDDGK